MKPSETVGFQHLAIHRSSSTAALFAAGWSGYSLMKLWPFVTIARNPNKPSHRLTTGEFHAHEHLD
jgi:hypothetical protein